MSFDCKWCGDNSRNIEIQEFYWIFIKKLLWSNFFCFSFGWINLRIESFVFLAWSWWIFVQRYSLFTLSHECSIVSIAKEYLTHRNVNNVLWTLRQLAADAATLWMQGILSIELRHSFTRFHFRSVRTIYLIASFWEKSTLSSKIKRRSISFSL